jgi:autoinducer 2-degrading protein
MYVTLVHVNVTPERLAEFIEASRLNHEGSITEPGNIRFDFLQSADDPARFVIFEAFVDEASAKAHKDTPHYAVWRDTVADWMVEPRRGVRYAGLFSESE